MACLLDQDQIKSTQVGEKYWFIPMSLSAYEFLVQSIELSLITVVCNFYGNYNHELAVDIFPIKIFR